MRKTEGSGLQSRADNHDSRSKEDHLPSPKYVTDEDGDDSADETPNIVTRYSNTLNCRNMVVGGIVDRIDLGKLFDPGSKGQKPASYSLIITKKAIESLAMCSLRDVKMHK